MSGVPTQVQSLDELKPGDHFSQDRGVYQHHGTVVGSTVMGTQIVSFTNPDKGVKSSLEDKKGARIMQEIMSQGQFTAAPVFRHDYADGACLPAETVVKRALEASNGIWQQYNLVTNNCEHFATWCKTGQGSSKQVDDKICSFVSGGVLEFIVKILISLIILAILYLILNSFQPGLMNALVRRLLNIP